MSEWTQEVIQCGLGHSYDDDAHNMHINTSPLQRPKFGCNVVITNLKPLTISEKCNVISAQPLQPSNYLQAHVACATNDNIKQSSHK